MQHGAVVHARRNVRVQCGQMPGVLVCSPYSGLHEEGGGADWIPPNFEGGKNPSKRPASQPPLDPGLLAGNWTLISLSAYPILGEGLGLLPQEFGVD